MTPEDRDALLEEEILIVRNSGEIPEIALHTSLFYLTQDCDGPQLDLEEHEVQALYDSAIERACEIVLRDLQPDNRDLGLYRGPARTIYNWRRLQKMCSRINRGCPGFDRVVADALISFLHRELADVESNLRCSSVNCSERDLHSFMNELSVDWEELPADWSSLCPE